MLLRVWVAVALLSAPLPLQAQVPAAAEYRTKANYLANFPSFVEWPTEGLPASNAPFLVCVFGEFSFGTSLAEITRGATVHDRRLEIRWVRKAQELAACQILFVSRSEQKRYNQASGRGARKNGAHGRGNTGIPRRWRDSQLLWPARNDPIRRESRCRQQSAPQDQFKVARFGAPRR